MPVTEAFYEAAIVPELWGEALNRASLAWEAEGAIVSSYPDCVSGYICSDSVKELCARFIDEGWAKQDVRSVRWLAFVRKGNELVTDFDVFTADELKQLPYYTDFLGRLGFAWFAGSLLTEGGGAQITLSVQRRTNRDPFTKDDLTRIQHDLPHVKRAARLTAKTRLSYAEGLVDSLERLTCGAILIDWLGRVTRMNRKAEAYLGSHFQIINGRLRLPSREANKSLQDLVAACTRPIISRSGDTVTSALIPRPGGLPLVVSSYPIIRRASDVFQGACGLLLISDPGEDRPLAPKILQEVFRLTPAEFRVAAALLRGLDTQQIANENEVGTQTVRYHLKSIFAKTGTNHQAQLVSLLSRFSE